MLCACVRSCVERAAETTTNLDLVRSGESERCGPLSREDAERQQREVRRIHEALLDRVGHLSPLRPGETPGYARQMLRLPVGGHSEGGEASPAVLYVREDYQIKPHGQVWEGSAAMARWICTQHGRLFVHTGQRGEEADPLAFLELGSGCGLPGLVLAALGYTVNAIGMLMLLLQ